MKRLSVWCAGVLAAVALPLYAYKVYDKTDYTDFSVYHLAAIRMAEGHWDQIYTLADGASPFRYPPLILPLFRWLAAFGPREAQLSWYFIQVLTLIVGFVALHRATRAATRSGRASLLPSLTITALSFLFVLRFCLDSFTIGQVSTLMFAGWALAAAGFILGRGASAGLGLAVPTLFKISPGFSYFLLLLCGRRKFAALLAPAVAVLALLVIVSAWPKGEISNFSLWENWTRIVGADAAYYDSSHYGSQSFNSVLLRAVKAGWLSPGPASALRTLLTIVGCAGLFLFWALRRPRDARGRGLFLACGVFPYLWFMPETFKYSLVMLAIPVAMLLSARKFSLLSLFGLATGVLFLSLPGKDLVTDSLFFGIQHASLPAAATLLLGLAVFREAQLGSQPSKLGLRLRKFRLNEELPGVKLRIR